MLLFHKLSVRYYSEKKEVLGAAVLHLTAVGKWKRNKKRFIITNYLFHLLALSRWICQRNISRALRVYLYVSIFKHDLYLIGTSSWFSYTYSKLWYFFHYLEYIVHAKAHSDKLTVSVTQRSPWMWMLTEMVLWRKTTLIRWAQMCQSLKPDEGDIFSCIYFLINNNMPSVTNWIYEIKSALRMNN